jgi:hypothetical protein
LTSNRTVRAAFLPVREAEGAARPQIAHSAAQGELLASAAAPVLTPDKNNQKMWFELAGNSGAKEYLRRLT